MRSGGDDFFTKPVAPEALIAAVASRARRSRLMTIPPYEETENYVKKVMSCYYALKD